MPTATFRIVLYRPAGRKFLIHLTNFAYRTGVCKQLEHAARTNCKGKDVRVRPATIRRMLSPAMLRAVIATQRCSDGTPHKHPTTSTCMKHSPLCAGGIISVHMNYSPRLCTVKTQEDASFSRHVVDVHSSHANVSRPAHSHRDPSLASVQARPWRKAR